MREWNSDVVSDDWVLKGVASQFCPKDGIDNNPTLEGSHDVTLCSGKRTHTQSLNAALAPSKLTTPE